MKTLISCFLFISLNAFAIPKDVTLVDLYGKPAQPSFNKKHLVLFWASWCKDCKAHLKKDIPSLARKFSIIAINIDGTGARARACMNAEEITFPSYRDESKSMQKSLKAFVTPFWAVYDGEKVVDSNAGFDVQRIERAIK